MPVTDQQFAALRSFFLIGDQAAIERSARLTDADMPAYEALLQAALTTAACRRFADGFSEGELIRYVARMRAGTPGRDEDMALDPLATEAMLHHALGLSAPVIKDPWTRLRSVFALLTVLLFDLDLDEAAADALLAQARTLADQWLSTASAR